MHFSACHHGCIMRVLVLVDHGSRLEEANAVVVEMAKLVQKRVGDNTRVCAAHMELAQPLLTDVLVELARNGATDVVVFPYMLAQGRHANEDIPRMAREALAPFPNVAINVLEPFGVEPTLANVIEHRLDACD